MQVYKDKIHEELRWLDYQLGDKGAQATAPAFRSPGFGSSTFGGKRGGSRVAAWHPPTAEEDGICDSVTQPDGKPESISAMQLYDMLMHYYYVLGVPISAPFSNPGFAASTSAFGSSAFGSSTNANPFGSTSSAAPSLFGSTTSTFGGNSASPFGSTPASSAFGDSTFISGSASAQGTTSTPFNSGLNFGNTQQSPLFQSTTPAIGQSSSAFGQAPSFGQTTPGFGQTNMFNNPSTGFGGNMFSSNPSLLTTSSPMGFGQTMAHPTHERYLNKKIEMYDEMQLVVGKDLATGLYTKSFVDLDAASTEMDSNPLEDAIEKENSVSSVPSSEKRSHRKRKQMNSEANDDGGIKELAMEVREIAKAMKDMTKQQLNVSDLYEEVMKVEGFDEIILGAAFDYLVQNEMLAKAFMVKNKSLKKIWIEKFVEKYKG